MLRIVDPFDNGAATAHRSQRCRVRPVRALSGGSESDYNRLQPMSVEWHFLTTLNEQLRLLKDPVEIQEAAVRLIGKHFHASRVNYTSIDGDEFVLSRSYADGVPPFAGRGSVFRFGKAIVDACRRGETVAVDDVTMDPRFTNVEREQLLVVPTAAFVATPLIKHGRWIATFGVHSATSRTGIVVAGLDARSHVYILADESLRASPDTWARRAIAAYHRHKAEILVAEANQGGEMVTFTLQTVDPDVDVQLTHASQGKRTRAEPVAALYEQGRVHHVGTFPELEDQLCLWDATSGDLSPDRLDALVWAVSELAVDGQPPLALVNTNTVTRADDPDRNWLRDILLRHPEKKVGP